LAATHIAHHHREKIYSRDSLARRCAPFQRQREKQQPTLRSGIKNEFNQPSRIVTIHKSRSARHSSRCHRAICGSSQPEKLPINPHTVQPFLFPQTGQLSKRCWTVPANQKNCPSIRIRGNLFYFPKPINFLKEVRS